MLLSLLCGSFWICRSPAGPRSVPSVLLLELQAAFRVPMLQVSDLSPCLTSRLEGTRPKGVEGTHFPDLDSQSWDGKPRP